MNYLTSEQNNPAENLKEIYNSEYCITLDELPDLKKYPLDGSDADSDAVLAGDVNLDNAVNLADIILLQKYLLGEVTLTKEAYDCADVNTDEAVNGLDLSRLRQMSLENA